MKILYGVQGTGNGHLSRARALAPHLKSAEIEVDYIFSGRNREDFFDMEIFGDYRCLRGLTLISKKGHLDRWQTIKQASLRQLVSDIRSLDISDYDLVLSDFEPVTAWAAKLQKKTCLGVGHQYAFRHKVPKANSDPLGQLLLKHFAPASESLGLHWHHFEQPILPPIIHSTSEPIPAQKKQVLVYLPFESTLSILDLLSPIKHYQFVLHCKDIAPGSYGNVTVFPFSKEQFQYNLQQSQSVLCNAGFELISEALQMGKRILAKPLHGQVEQLSNAKALQQLDLADTIKDLTTIEIKDWLESGQMAHVRYPDVAKHIVDWLISGRNEPVEHFSQRMWEQVEWIAPATENLKYRSLQQ